MQYLQLAIALMGEENAKKLSQQQLQLLAQQYSDIHGIPLPELEHITPDQLGPSNVGSMQVDQGLRGKQLQAIAEIQNQIDHGGLDFNDKATLEEAMGSAANQQKRARAGVESDAEQRGQLNSGNRLMMDLDAAQAGENTAHKTALETAALAQQRRLAAIHDVAGMSGALRNQDWSEEQAANAAKDLRDERNAAAREKAQYYNAGLPQQNFTNAMSKATGTQPAANAYGGGLGNAATDTRMSAAGIVGAVGAASNNGGGGGGVDQGANTYSYDTARRDENGDRGGYTDLSRDDPNK